MWAQDAQNSSDSRGRQFLEPAFSVSWKACETCSIIRLESLQPTTRARRRGHGKIDITDLFRTYQTAKQSLSSNFGMEACNSKAARQLYARYSVYARWRGARSWQTHASNVPSTYSVIEPRYAPKLLELGSLRSYARRVCVRRLRRLSRKTAPPATQCTPRTCYTHIRTRVLSSFGIYESRRESVWQSGRVL